jgi:hypothetical protein
MSGVTRDQFVFSTAGAVAIAPMSRLRRRRTSR